MTIIGKWLASRRATSALTYMALVLLLLIAAVAAVVDTIVRYEAVSNASTILARLEQRVTSTPEGLDWSGEDIPPGPPFLQGDTVTLAAASLVEKITNAVARAKGTVVSYEIDPQMSPAKDGYIKVIATCDVEQAELQRLLYDLEAGMPFLFIDQLVAQTSAPPTDNGRLRLLLGVTGLWPGGK